MVNQTLTALGDGRGMRRLVAIAVLSLALAAPAAAQQGRIVVPKEPSVSLRGPVGDAPAEGEARDETSPLAALIPAPPPVAPTGSRVVLDNRQCKRSCSRDYYFCLSADEESCAPAWTKCMAGCG